MSKRVRTMMYHGTTKNHLDQILKTGLKKGSWCSPDFWVAKYFGEERGRWNLYPPVVIVAYGNFTKVRHDRHGRNECQLIQLQKLEIHRNYRED